MLFAGNLTRKLCKNMKREVATMWIQKHVRRSKAQKAQKHVQCGYKSTCTDRKLKKWEIEYEDSIADAFPLSMKSLLLRVLSC